MTSLLTVSVIALVKRCWSAAEMLSGNFLVGSRKGSEAMMPSHCAGTFSSRKRTGMSLSFIPARNLMQARDVILVVLDRIQWNGERHIRETRLRPLHVIHRHLVFFELEIRDSLRQRTLHHLVRQFVLFRKAGRRNGVQARQKTLIGGLLTLISRGRKIFQLIVISVIADGGRAFRVSLEIRLVLLLEKRVLRGNPGGGRFVILGGGSQ